VLPVVSRQHYSEKIFTIEGVCTTTATVKYLSCWQNRPKFIIIIIFANRLPAP
jgi:hypothetical protein